MRSPIQVGLLLLLLAGEPVGEPLSWRPCARIESRAIDECSGLVSSRRHAGVLWVHNDSGDVARLFALDRSGRLLREVRLPGARNVDWEDIATDDSGHLYIGDFGNNKNERRDLVVYVIDEPDPRAKGDAILEIPLLRRIHFYFPQQRGFPDIDALNFDCEAMFWHAGELYVLTKHRSDTRTALYRLPKAGDKPGAAVWLGDTEIGSPVTAADMSADGRMLAILSYQYIHLFEPAPGEGNFLRAPSHRVLIEGRQCEGISFDDGNVLFANEQREIYCLPLAELRDDDSFLPVPPRVRLQRLALPPRTPSEWEAMVSLPLRPEIASPASKAEPVPELRLGWCDAGLYVRAEWPIKRTATETGKTLLTLMCGPPGEAVPRLQKGQRVWEARVTRDGLQLYPILPEPGAPVESCQVRWTDSALVLEAVLPIDVAAGGNLALNAIVQLPAAKKRDKREWAWAGGSSTQPLENPLLWGRVDLVP